MMLMTGALGFPGLDRDFRRAVFEFGLYEFADRS
jgi:hypothetical protein